MTTFQKRMSQNAMDYYVTKLFSNANEEKNEMTGVVQARTKFK